MPNNPTDLGPKYVKVSALQLQEKSADPPTPVANTVILYAKDNGGKTTLYALFPTGSAVEVAAEV